LTRIDRPNFFPPVIDCDRRALLRRNSIADALNEIDIKQRVSVLNRPPSFLQKLTPTGQAKQNQSFLIDPR
ncbi:unnamed protein product, partial [Linum tenue]